jgi:hypothetical protein
MKRALIIFSALALLAVVVTRAGITVTQEPATASDSAVRDQWEYLVVSGSGSNLTPSGNPNLRKEPSGPFIREEFVLEQNLDKLGAKGWELVSVSGVPSNPIYYFKRRK